MGLDQFIYILAGSTFGLILRLLIQYNFKIKKIFYYKNILIINVLASLILGILVALSINNQNLLLLFYVGFLGCFSTFSSFIYQLFNLIQDRKYLGLILYYIKVLALSFLFFYLGYFIILFI